MLATRTNKNNSIRVTLVKWKWNSYPKFVPPNIWSILQQRNERECVLAIKLESKSKGNPSKNVWEGVRVSMRAHHPSLGLYLKNLGKCTRGRARHNDQEAVGEGVAQEPLALGRPTCGVGRPQGGPPWCPPLARWFLNGYKLWKYGAQPKVCSKRCPNYFSKGFLNSENIFGIFVKREKC